MLGRASVPPSPRPDAAFVGIDLAWSDRGLGRTGIAVLGDDGRLARSLTVHTDDEIAAALGTDAHAGLLVAAIDAPIVVTNAHGQRTAERDVSRRFGHAGASTYPANRGNPLFDPPRASILAERFGWVYDAVAPRMAIEVYPHAAMVSALGLPRIFPYKAKPNRTLESRRAAFTDMMLGLETVGGDTLDLATNERWRELRHTVRTATRPVDLQRVEDEVDAIWCAWIAWRWGTERSRMLVFGDFATGAIIVPERLTSRSTPPDGPPRA